MPNFLFRPLALAVEQINYPTLPALNAAIMKLRDKGAKKMKPKKVVDPRHLKRQKAVRTLFAYSYDQKAKRKKTKPVSLLAKKVISKSKKIDKVIMDAAPKWPIEKINRIDLAILRLAVWELYFNKKTPPKVAIDEAIELAKEYGAENSSSFVNGALGTIYKKQENESKKS